MYNFKYHYVVFGYEPDYFQIMFHDAVKNADVEYIEDPIHYSIDNAFFRSLCALHNNRYINHFLKLPFKHVWYPLFYKNKQNKPLCFVFLMHWNRKPQNRIIEVFRKHYPSSKFVLYLEDIVESDRLFDYDAVDIFDMVVTYDKGDSMKYGYTYLPSFLSKIEIMSDSSNHSNCCFVGLPKNRVSTIYTLYDQLKLKGLKCDFVLPNVKKSERCRDGINYSNKFISYKEYLGHIANTDCIIEIMQKNASGYTLRTWEALLYGKKLLTNNKSILTAPFYTPDQFIYFEDASRINAEKIVDNRDLERFPAESLSPVKLFELIENAFS